MLYKTGDKFVMTKDKEVLLTPFTALRLKTGDEGFVITSDQSEYTVQIKQVTLKINSTFLHMSSKPAYLVDKRYTKVIETGLTYGQAMDKLILEKKKVARAVFDGYWAVEVIGNLNNAPSWSGNFIVAYLKNGSQAIATPYQEDMFAMDWMVVE